MTDLPERCNHPAECVKMHDGLLTVYFECERCGYTMSRDEWRMRDKEQPKEQKKLVTE